jgi:lipid-A-disaccharide synthase
MVKKTCLRIGIIAGEASGDALGAGLINALREKYSNLEIEGIAGPKMIQAGCKAIYPMDKLAVMGIIEPLKHLPELIKIRSQLGKHFLKNPPDVFIGIDAPDFNLGLEVRLKKAGIPVVHYVSPTVWAWRKGRIHKIKRAVDLMLTLFPFEVGIYKEHNISVKCVGHTLADEIDPNLSLEKENFLMVRKKLGLQPDSKILALLPGSRAMELKHLAEVFLHAAKICVNAIPELKIITAMANTKRRKQFEEIIERVSPKLPITIYDGNAQEVILASDAVLLAGGTVALETLLLKRPMVVAYKMSRLNYLIGKALIKIDYFSLPNLIAGKRIVPEFLQKEVIPETLATNILQQLNDVSKKDELIAEFAKIHQKLRRDASKQAAEAVIELAEFGHHEEREE